MKHDNQVSRYDRIKERKKQLMKKKIGFLGALILGCLPIYGEELAFKDCVDSAELRTDARQKLYIYIKNPLNAPLEINTAEVFVNKQKIIEGGRKDKQPCEWYDIGPSNGEGAIWFDVCPNPVQPGKYARLGIRFYRNDEIGEKINLKLQSVDGRNIEGDLKVASKPSIKMISYSFTREVLYLCAELLDKNESMQKIILNGEDLSSKCTLREVISNDGKKYSLAEIRLSNPLPEGSYAFVNLVGSKCSGTELLRVIKPFFPVGLYAVEDEKGGIDEKHLKDCSEHLINCIHVTFKRLRTGGNLDILQKYGIKAIFDPEWGAKLPSVLKKYKDDPSILAWYAGEEPEIQKNGGRPARFLASPERRLQNFRELGSSLPTFSTHCPWHSIFYDYAGLFDIALLDDYPICSAPFTRVMKTMEEGSKAYGPSPIWFVLQAFNGPAFGGRYPSPDELDFMASAVMGMGAKGIFYFNYGHVVEPCYGVGEPMRELCERYPAGKQLLQEDLPRMKEKSEKLWGKIRDINSNLKMLEDIALISTPLQIAKSDNEKVEVLSLVSPSSLLVFALNKDFNYESYPGFPVKDTSSPKKAAVFKTAAKTGIELKLPSWFKVADLLEVSGGNVHRIPFVAENGTLKFSMDELKVSRTFVVSPDSNLLSKLQEKRYTSGIISIPAIKSPLIDGDLSEWEKMEPIVIDPHNSSPGYFYRKDFKESEDLSVKVYMGHDDKKLYIAAKIRDDVQRQDYTEGGIWFGDLFQVAFDPENDGGMSFMKDDSEYGFALTNKGMQAWAWKNPNANKSNRLREDISFKIKRDANYTFYELAIPFDELGISPNKVFGFNFIVGDIDKEPGFIEGEPDFLQLSPGLMGGKLPSYFSKFILTEDVK